MTRSHLSLSHARTEQKNLNDLIALLLQRGRAIIRVCH